MNDSTTQINKERLLKLLADLVNIYSPSGKEHELAGYIQSYLETFGFPLSFRKWKRNPDAKRSLYSSS